VTVFIVIGKWRKLEANAARERVRFSTWITGRQRMPSARHLHGSSRIVNREDVRCKNHSQSQPCRIIAASDRTRSRAIPLISEALRSGARMALQRGPNEFAVSSNGQRATSRVRTQDVGQLKHRLAWGSLPQSFMCRHCLRRVPPSMHRPSLFRRIQRPVVMHSACALRHEATVVRVDLLHLSSDSLQVPEVLGRETHCALAVCGSTRAAIKTDSAPAERSILPSSRRCPILRGNGGEA
jgi:hypothetical protein